MTRKIVMVAMLACAGFMTACDSSPSAPDGLRPQYDGRTRRTTTTTTTTSTAPGDTTAVVQDAGGAIGDPCDPETYVGPYRCIPDPNNDGGYVIAY
jgi:hypothetical protein